MESRTPSSLTPYASNARRHSKKQIKQIAASIKRFGFTVPVIINDKDVILAGHGRVEAAKLLGLETIPVVQLSHLTPTECRAYVLADNKLALNAGWDVQLLATELQVLIGEGFEIDLTGFSPAEIDLTLDAAAEALIETGKDRADDIPIVQDAAVTRPGDLWTLGRHKLLCGSALDAAAYQILLGGEAANLLITDPPYNVPIDGNVCGSGRVRHREFAMGVGEMDDAQFTGFLRDSLGNAAGVCQDGAIAFVFMDWRHQLELLTAARPIFSELKNLCVWNKTNGGMGTFYRSKHELVFVFKVGTAPHINTFGLGGTGRPRSNVWDYAGISSIGPDRAEALAMHPTVKPTALVADAIRDCSLRGHVVLDPFGGSGTTLVAAEVCGRSARLIELDPLYCDVTIRRYERLTGKSATLADGSTFEEVEASRAMEVAHV